MRDVTDPAEGVVMPTDGEPTDALPTDTGQCERCHAQPAGAGGTLCDDCFAEISASLS